jgi:4-hydroxybenzoate polyprenyltransferase
LKAGLLSIIYFALCFGLWLPDPFWFLISRFTWLPLLSVNSAITSINDKEIADFKNNDKLSGNNWCTVVVGGLLIASIAVGNFMFPEIWE